jgi:hypothetical protein
MSAIRGLGVPNHLKAHDLHCLASILESIKTIKDYGRKFTILDMTFPQRFDIVFEGE